MSHLDSNSGTEQKPCRQCSDFKTWAKQQREKRNQKSGVSNLMEKNVFLFNFVSFKRENCCFCVEC